MGYFEDICRFQPTCEQESADQQTIMEYIRRNGDSALYRNSIAHITCSSMIVNSSLTKTLMILHRLRGAWAWTGGHADGDRNLLGVALREAKEETGLAHVEPLSKEIASIDIFAVGGHIRKGEYVGSHLHLSVAYLFIADENASLRSDPNETGGCAWLPVTELTESKFDDYDVYLYDKMLTKARAMRSMHTA